MRTHNFLFYGLFLVVAVAAIVVILLSKSQKESVKPIGTFEECVHAGYPVMESYPRQCSLPSGKFFTETIIPEK